MSKRALGGPRFGLSSNSIAPPPDPHLSPLCRWSPQVPYLLSASCTRTSVSLASADGQPKHSFKWSWEGEKGELA